MKKLNEAQVLIMHQLKLLQPIKMSDLNRMLEEGDNLARTQELAYYMNKLVDFGFIRINEGTYATGGTKHPIYGNNVRQIWFDRLDLLPAGQRAIEEGVLDNIEIDRSPLLTWLKSQTTLEVKVDIGWIYPLPRGIEPETRTDTLLLSKDGFKLKHLNAFAYWGEVKVFDEERAIAFEYRFPDIGANLVVFIPQD